MTANEINYCNSHRKCTLNISFCIGTIDLNTKTSQTKIHTTATAKTRKESKRSKTNARIFSLKKKRANKTKYVLAIFTISFFVYRVYSESHISTLDFVFFFFFAMNSVNCERSNSFESIIIDS